MFLAVLVACAHPAAPLPAEAPAQPPGDAVRHYTIWLGGARIGTATEAELWSPAGVTLRRVEDMRFSRGGQLVIVATSIEIEASVALVPQRVRWTEIGSEIRSAEVAHDDRGWHDVVRRGDSDVVRRGESDVAAHTHIPASAVPAELLPLLVRRDGRFAGPVFLPARAFVVGTARIEPIAARRFVASLAVGANAANAPEGSASAATIDLADDGMPDRVVDGEGIIEVRASAATAREPFAPVDLIAATAIPIAGARAPASTPGDVRLVLDGDLALPPLPGQRAEPSPSGIAVELSARLPGDLPPGEPGRDCTHNITALVALVRTRIRPTLATSPATSRDPGAIAGDCTTFALAYAALAKAHHIPTRLVTGLRVDAQHARLVRHRWAVSWTGTRWIAVDAAFGAAPAGGNLIGLAVHDADEAGLVSGEAALAAVRSAYWATGSD